MTFSERQKLVLKLAHMMVEDCANMRVSEFSDDVGAERVRTVAEALVLEFGIDTDAAELRNERKLVKELRK